MQKNSIIIIKNVFCVITIIWTLIMMFEYLLILTPFNLQGLIYEVFDFFIIFLYFGIFAVPALLIISIILMSVIKEKLLVDSGKILNIITIIMPCILGILMILTKFNDRLQ